MARRKESPLDAASFAIVEAFESGWETARRDVATFFSQHALRPTRLLVELAAIELENRLKRGEAATVGDDTAKFQERADDDAVIRELARIADRFAEPAADNLTAKSQDSFATTPRPVSGPGGAAPGRLPPVRLAPSSPGTLVVCAHTWRSGGTATASCSGASGSSRARSRSRRRAAVTSECGSTRRSWR